MNKLPCIDCIVLPVCRKMVLDKSPKIGGEIFSKCTLINEYVLIKKEIETKGLIKELEISINNDRLDELLEYMKNV